MLASRHNSHIFDPDVFREHVKADPSTRRRGIRTTMPRSCVLVQGLHRSGKTTLLNALLGGHYFPYFARAPSAAASAPTATMSIFDIRDRPSISWSDVPVNILLHRDKQTGDMQTIAFSLPPFLAQAARERGTNTTACTVALKMWQDSFSPVKDDSPLPRPPISIPFALPFTAESRASLGARVDDEYVMVGVMNDASCMNLEERHAAQAHSVVQAIEHITSRMEQIPHFMTVDCVPLNTTAVATGGAALEDADGDALSNCSFSSSASSIASSTASSTAMDDMQRMTFIEGQEISDRPPMHRVHTVLYVLDENEMLRNHATEFRSSVFTSAKAAMTCDGLRCQAYLVVNRHAKTVAAAEAAAPHGSPQTAEDYAREFRVPTDNVFILDLRAALALALLPGAQLRTPRGIALELQRLHRVIANNHVANVRDMHAAAAASEAAATAATAPPQSATSADAPTPVPDTFKVTFPAPTRTSPPGQSATENNSGYVPVVLRSEFQREASLSLKEAADALVPDATTASARQQSDLLSGSASGSSSASYVPRVLRGDEQQREAAEHHAMMNSYVPKVLRQ